MTILRRVTVLIVFLTCHLTAGFLPCLADDGDKPTDKQLEKLESTSKYFASKLIEAKLWTKNEGSHKKFSSYRPKDTVIVPIYDEEKEDFLDVAIDVTGAEYRYAFVVIEAWENLAKLDEDGQRRFNKEVFGKEDKVTDKELAAGKAKLKKMVIIVQGEKIARQK